MKKINGFTLTELLATIVIIALLLGLGVPGVMKVSESMKKRAYNTKINLIEQAGVLWGQDNKTRLQNESDCDVKTNDNNKEGTYRCIKIDVNELLEEDYLSADGLDDSGDYILKDPVTDKSIKDCEVFVYKKNNRVYAYFDKENCNK